MFPSSRNRSEDTKQDVDHSWLRNASFAPQTAAPSRKQEDASVAPEIRTSAQPTRVEKLDDSGYCYELNRKGDPANIGSDRTYFKQLPKYVLRKRLSKKQDDKPTKRYFRTPGLDSPLQPVEFLRRSVEEWLSLYVDEQENARNIKHGNQRLQQFLYHIRSALQVDHPKDGCLRSIEYRLRRQLGESGMELVDEWRRALRSAIYDFDDWDRYLSFLTSSSAHRMSDIRREYLEYMNIQLADIEDSGGTHERYGRIIDTLFSYALSLSDAGYNENAVALFQALLDYNMIQLAAREASIGQYRQFWLSGLPRLGEQGYRCWWTLAGNNGKGPNPVEDPTEPFNLDADLPQPLQWLQNEAQRERAHWLPFRQINFPDLEDPARYVKFNELFIFRIPPAAVNKLLIHIVLSLGILLGPGILPPLTSPTMVALIERLPTLYHILSRHHRISGRVVGNPSALSVKEYFRRIMEQLSAFENQRFAELYHALLLIEMSLADTDAKKVLANHRQNISLFAAYFAMYPSEKILAGSTSLSLFLSQADNVDVCTLQGLTVPSADESSSDLDRFNARLLTAAVNKQVEVFKDRTWMQEHKNDLHVRRRRFLHYCRLALQLGTLSTEEFFDIVVHVIETSMGQQEMLLYDCSLAQFVTEMLLRQPAMINLVKQWRRRDWIVCLMRLYSENEKLRQFLTAKDECSILPPVNRMKHLINEAVDCYPESVLFHRLRSSFSSQFLTSVETELAFTSGRLQVPFDKSVYMDHIRWVASHCLNRPDFEWRTLVQSMEQDRGIRIKLPLPEFDELRSIYKDAG